MENNFYEAWHSQVLSAVSNKILSLLEQQRTADVDNLLHAMIYSCDGSGKCIRPLLVHAAGVISNACPKTLCYLGAALEIIHSFSLVHDDLPCMDNDDYRRGKLSNHKVFGADIALLAGDALLVYAFELLSSNSFFKELSAEVMLKIIHLVTKAIGVHGMVGGQALDMMYTNQKVTYEQLKNMHILKTGMLISCACLVGYIVGTEYQQEKYDKLVTISDDIGLLFQIVDDILDVTSSSKVLGKTANKDTENNKATFVTILGLDQAQQHANNLFDKLQLELHDFPNSGYLKYLVNVIHKRSK